MSMRKSDEIKPRTLVESGWTGEVYRVKRVVGRNESADGVARDGCTMREGAIIAETLDGSREVMLKREYIKVVKECRQ